MGALIRLLAVPSVLWIVSCAAVPAAQEADDLYREALEHPARARELLDRAVALDPSRPEFFTLRARTCLASGRLADAVRDYGAAIPLLERRPAERAAIHLARALLRDPDGAEEDLAAALALFPDYVEVLLERARLRRLGHRPIEAGEDEAHACRVGAGFAARFHNEGVLALNQGRFEEAERAFGFALVLDPVFADAHVALGRAAFERRRFAAATEALGRAISLRPRDAELRVHRGNALFAQSLHAPALDDFKVAVDLDPTLPPAWAGLGMSRARMKDPAGAQEAFARALELDRGCYPARLNLGLLLHELGRLEEAEREILLALAIFTTAEGVQSLGRVVLDRGDRPRATGILEKALTICRDAALRGSIEADLLRAREPAP